MKTITFITIILTAIVIIASLIFKLADTFLTATTIFYLASGVAVYLAITGAKKDLEKKTIN